MKNTSSRPRYHVADELEYLDPFDGVWYPVVVIRDDGDHKVKVYSDLTLWEYWADRERLRWRAEK